MIIKRLIFIIVFLAFSLFFSYFIFYPIFYANYLKIQIPFSPLSFTLKTVLFENLKLLYFFTFIFSNLIYSNLIFNKFFYKLILKKEKNQAFNFNSLHLFISNDEDGLPIVIPEDGLYQNILITGTIRHWENQFSNVSFY